MSGEYPVGRVGAEGLDGWNILQICDLDLKSLVSIQWHVRDDRILITGIHMISDTTLTMTRDIMRETGTYPFPPWRLPQSQPLATRGPNPPGSPPCCCPPFVVPVDKVTDTLNSGV